ncbi:hypothetical protein BT67DRAFT_440358 [Trichocladium antarcticum]|uniref:THUMP domain-containing protein n=1 Tax=Trichocladium antarcticum TaxID=1450529 RepID=A0AAN6UNC6_9PEZI|nr:hypothetical protein BT67DRAFT_440358 [Trichocladium antarcticum]
MAENKRKGGPSSGGAHDQSRKKKTGNAGKWRTPHQEAKAGLQQGHGVQPGDTGVWVTCARHQEGKAAREVGVLFAEYAEKMYGIKSVHDVERGEGDEADDIETAIRKEVAALNSSRDGTDGAANSLTAVKMNVDCLLFVKTEPPIDPVAFVRRIVEDAKACNESGQMRCRYLNRLTPVTVSGKATEQGLVEVAREALAPFFDLSGKRAGVEGSGEAARPAGPGDGDAPVTAAEEKAPGTEGNEAAAAAERKPFTFAIRPSIRNHGKLKRDFVINTIAGMVNDDVHKVNLTSPDKVILIDVYQTVCGISVVDGDWDALKRYNLTELYSQARNAQNTEAGREEGSQ